MRKKTKQSLAIADIGKAWGEFFDEQKVSDVESLNKDGWYNTYQIAERLNMSVPGVQHKLTRMKVETKMATVKMSGSARRVRFFRMK